jgi:hypothetical protein
MSWWVHVPELLVSWLGEISEYLRRTQKSTVVFTSSAGIKTSPIGLGLDFQWNNTSVFARTKNSQRYEDYKNI